jgi:hypothetical protein
VFTGRHQVTHDSSCIATSLLLDFAPWGRCVRKLDFHPFPPDLIKRIQVVLMESFNKCSQRFTMPFAKTRRWRVSRTEPPCIGGRVTRLSDCERPMRNVVQPLKSGAVPAGGRRTPVSKGVSRLFCEWCIRISLCMCAN